MMKALTSPMDTQDEQQLGKSPHIIALLSILNNVQVDKLITDFQQMNKAETLKYLLKRTG